MSSAYGVHGVYEYYIFNLDNQGIIYENDQQDATV
jgi:hypothetical protein